ncbi:MAG: excinuclease ABC subunit UvrA [Phycisphaeraceae bacterium]|nr:excinuclease ABC subunit UvrA [Phycisphaeraceae bacterium]
MALTSISIRGAREHNLKGINVDIPHGKFVVVTGLSGSGKSSLAFDTIYAEGQRKYVESLSAYARQFLDQLQKPNVESIEGLPPTIAIEQRSASHNPRSTVATTTEIYDYLRLLFARAGAPHCWYTDDRGKVCGRPITSQSATQIVDAVFLLPAETRVMILSPVVRGKKGHHREVFEALSRQGFVRARVDGEVMDLREIAGKKEGTPFTTKTQRYQAHSIEAVVDRIVVREDRVSGIGSQDSGKNEDDGLRTRVADSVELALKLADGLVVISHQSPKVSNPKPDTRNPTPDAWTDTTYSEKWSCPEHPECSLEDLEPRLFSFNSPYGACPKCGGLGNILEFDPDLIVPDDSISLTNGAVDAWRRHGMRMNIYYNRMIRRFCRDFKVSAETPFKKLPKVVRNILLFGTNARDEQKFDAYFEGVIPNLQRRWENTDSEYVKTALHTYLSEAPCEACSGARLQPAALSVFINDRNINDVTRMTIEQALDYFSSLKLSPEGQAIAAPILKEINARLVFMLNVGLGYLTLNRSTGSLSGGEAQRIRLATQVGSGLVGCCYVLDEPTIGLHQRDNDRLIATLRHLTDIGNTVVVVEHDEATIRAADYIIDLGPGPGVHGGQIVAEGTPKQVLATKNSLTAQYLTGVKAIEVPNRRELDHDKPLIVCGAAENNLRKIDVAFPLGGIVAVTGVSGSGKSTLVNQIMLRAVRRALLGSRDKPGAHDKLENVKRIDRMIEVDQSPIGRTPRSNPATYTGVFDSIRQLFSKTKESKIRGYTPGRFSFNVKGGRCEACQGQGTRKIEMHFLPDVYVACDQCKGKRYNRETLEVTYKGRNIADVLAMTVEEAMGFFDSFADISRMMTALNDVGLSYLELGQPSTTLSGGEAQRVKLATELGKRATGHTLYILDEPTTGLHFDDVARLLSVLARLADAGNSIVVIEHNLDVIKCADWIIDLGPEGGDRGGSIVAEGTPEQVARHKTSYTGRYLRQHLPQYAEAVA